jgi:hypothetical protein
MNQISTAQQTSIGLYPGKPQRRDARYKSSIARIICRFVRAAARHSLFGFGSVVLVIFIDLNEDLSWLGSARAAGPTGSRKHPD